MIRGHETLSDSVSNGGGLPLPEDSKRDYFKYISVLLNFIDT